MSATTRKKKKLEARKKKKSCKKFKVTLSCGCCFEILYFLSEERINKEFQNIGLVSNTTIKDDAGRIINKIDTFYGYENCNLV